MRKTNAEYSRKWRENNREKDRAIHIQYYNENKDKSHQRVIKYRLYKSKVKRLMNILLI